MPDAHSHDPRPKGRRMKKLSRSAKLTPMSSCILLLAMLAACGGGSSPAASSSVPDAVGDGSMSEAQGVRMTIGANPESRRGNSAAANVVATVVGAIIPPAAAATAGAGVSSVDPASLMQSPAMLATSTQHPTSGSTTSDTTAAPSVQSAPAP